MTPRFKPEQKFRPEQRLTWQVTATLIGVVDREPEWNDHLGCYIYDLRYLGIQDETNPLKMKIATLVSHLEPDLTLLNPNSDDSNYRPSNQLRPRRTNR